MFNNKTHKINNLHTLIMYIKTFLSLSACPSICTSIRVNVQSFDTNTDIQI